MTTADNLAAAAAALHRAVADARGAELRRRLTARGWIEPPRDALELLDALRDVPARRLEYHTRLLRAWLDLRAELGPCDALRCAEPAHDLLATAVERELRARARLEFEGAPLDDVDRAVAVARRLCAPDAGGACTLADTGRDTTGTTEEEEHDGQADV